MLEMDLYAEIGQGGTLLENLAPHQKQIAPIAKQLLMTSDQERAFSKRCKLHAQVPSDI